MTGWMANLLNKGYKSPMVVNNNVSKRDWTDTLLKKKSKHLHNKKVLDAIEINIWRIKIEFEQIYSVRHFCPHVSSFFMVRHCA